MNTFMNGLVDNTNYTYTENGGITHKTTKSDLMDLFALGGAYRSRSDADVINLFKNAYEEDPLYALKCLFYLRDILCGQGERRFFRVALNWLAKTDPEAVRRNVQYIPMFGRYDDLYCLVDTPVEVDAFSFITHQLALDVQSKTPSLLAKWLKSENTSSKESRKLATKTRKYLGMTSRQYRKTLSTLRERINVLERLMSAGQWDKIEFDKIPSQAGMRYRNAFARHDVERMRMATTDSLQSYEDFAKDTTKKVNAKALAPYECVREVVKKMEWHYLRGTTMEISETERNMINKYWDNLTDYFQNATLNGICVVDTSGSMTHRSTSVSPIDVAISLGLYCAEHNSGPFANHYISFASRPQLIRTDGVDFCDKVFRIYKTNLVDTTNIEAVFDLLLNTAMQPGVKKEDIPKNVIIISDMEFDSARGYGWKRYASDIETTMETIMRRWEEAGLEAPNLVFWNVDARQNNIPMQMKHGVTFVSGFSPATFEMLMSGKTAQDLVYEKLNSERYSVIK